MSTVTEIQNLIDDIIDTNKTDFPAAKKVRLMNKAQDKIVNIIMEKDSLQQWDDDNYGDLNEGYLNLVDGQADYFLDEDENFADILFISKVYILPSATATEYVELEKEGKSIPETIEGTPTTYRLSGKSIIVKQTPSYNATNGMKVMFSRAPKPIVVADTIRKPGIPVTFHHLLALYTAYDFARAKTLANRSDVLNEIVQEEQRLGIFVRKQDHDTVKTITTEYINSI